MSNCAFGLPTENRVIAGTLMASDAVANLDVTQLQNDHGGTSTSWRTQIGNTAGQFVVVDAREPVTWDAVGLFNANFTSFAFMRFRFSNDPGFATTVADSGILTGLTAPGYRQAIYIHQSTVTARCMRFDVSDGSNPEGFLRVAQMFAGPLRRPARTIGYDTRFQRTATRGEVVTRGGQKYYDLQYARRAWTLSLPALRSSEVWPLTQELQRAADAGGNVLFVPFPADADVARQAVFGPLVDPSPVSWTGPLRNAWTATIEERL